MTVHRRDAAFPPAPPRYRLPPYRVAAAYTQLGETIDWGLALLNVPEQWRITRGGGVRVAVLDTGLDLTHPDLVGAVDEARDFTGSRFGPADRSGHGTHTAGTIGARRNDRGVVGIAPECRLLVGKVLGDDGAGTDDAVAAGIDWAVATGADVLSLSLGSPTPSRAIEAAIRRAVAAGKFVVCAAGNSGRDDSVDYPAKLEEVIAVGAVDRGGYAKLSGTSMAAPFVSGVVALVVAKHRALGGDTPIATPQQMLEHLERTALDAGPAGRDPSYGCGLINPQALLADAGGPFVDGTAERIEIGPIALNGRPGKFVFVRETSS